MLKSITKHPVGFLEVSRAWDRASEYKKACLARWKGIYENETRKMNKLRVMLLGRPYTVLSKFMNKGIPGIFASLGIRVFFQDMLSLPDDNGSFIEGLLREMHWNYASEILRAAHEIASTRGIYPVFITSFRCSPDSFAIDYFKKIMESFDKPYLILQLDEHESSLGYETRIEAAIRSFENHFSGEAERPALPHTPELFPVKKGEIPGKTLVIPCWDDITLKFVTANLIREGIDARLMKGSEANIQKCLRHNTGQCIPVNIIARNFIDYVTAHDLDPGKTLLWMISSKIACNIGLFPLHLKSLFNSHGKGMEKAGVYTGNLSFIDISLKLPINSYFAYMFGGFIRKIGCRLRPYENNRGATDRVLRQGVDILIDAFLGNRSKEEALSEVIARFESIDISTERKPKVAIFGDLYVRDNDLMNQDLISYIEKHNGEVIVTPYSSYVQMIEKAYLKKWFFEGRYLDILSSKALMSVVKRLERVYQDDFGRILENPAPGYEESPEKILKAYHLRLEHTGESMDNLLKIHYLKKHYPDISLFVQTSPAFCCPSLVTEAMAKAIEKKIGVPIVSITYDGTYTKKNEAILPYLSHLD